MRRRSRIVMASISLAVMLSLFLLSSLPRTFLPFATAQHDVPPTTAISTVQHAWQLAEERGAYRYNSTVDQTTQPQPSLATAGMSSRRQQIYIEGTVDRPAETMQMKIWSDRGSVVAGQGAIEMKVADGVTWGRGDNGIWQQVESGSDLFAPGGDPLGFLNAAIKIHALPSDATAATRNYTRYAYDIDGPAFANHMRQRMTADLASRGELPAGITLDPSPLYLEMQGQGELWIDNTTGLPLRQQLTLAFPPTGNEQVSAQIVTDFHKWAAAAPLSGSAWLQWRAERFVQQLDGGALATTTLLLLSGIGFALLVVLYARSRKLYNTFAPVLIVSMVVTPLLSTQQVSAFYSRQDERSAQNEAELAEQEKLLDLRAAENRPAIAPHEDPLAHVNRADLALPAQKDATSTVATVSAQSTTPPKDLCAALDQLSTQYDIRSTQPITDFLKQLPVGVDMEDSDGDGLTLSQELFLCTDPSKADSDGDGLRDGLEVNELGTEPTAADSDGDSLPDNLEVAGFSYNNKKWYLNPVDQDTNKDGVADGTECFYNRKNKSMICPDSDGDGTPDVWDTDDDNDQVPDKVDAARTARVGDVTTGLTDGEFSFTVQDLTPNKPVYVDFQLRPTNPDHLWYTLNVLDWPSEDTDGQIQRKLDTTFYDMLAPQDQPYADPQFSDGDLRLTPMLEVELRGTPLPLPLTTPATAVKISTVATGTVALTQAGANVDMAFTFDNPTAGYDIAFYAVNSCDALSTELTPSQSFTSVNSGALRAVNGQSLAQDLADGNHVVQLSDGSATICAPIPNIVNGGYADQMVDAAAMADFGVSVREKDNSGTLIAYVPLTLIRDGDGNTPVAFAGRMFYQSPNTTLGASQSTRLVWLVEALSDHCTPVPTDFATTLDDSERYKKWCEDSSHWLSGSTIAHVYDDDWYLTGFDVREDHGIKVAVAFQDPAFTVAQTNFSADKFNEDALWSLAQGLERSFLAGRSSGDSLTMTVDDIVNRFDKSHNGSSTTEERWGLAQTAFQVSTYSFAHQSLVATLGMTQIPQLLDTQFNSYASTGQITHPTFLFAGEERARTLSLDATESITPVSGGDWTNGTTTANNLALSLAPENVLMLTQATLNWKPYSYDSGQGSWQTAAIETYWTDLGAGLEQVLAASFPDEANLDAARLIAQSYYLTLFHGIGQLIGVSNATDFSPVTLPAQLSDTQIFALAQISSDLGWAIKNMIGQVDHILINHLTKIAVRNDFKKIFTMEGGKAVLRQEFLNDVFGNSRLAGYMQNGDTSFLKKCVACKVIGDGGVVGIGAAVLTVASSVVKIALSFTGDINNLTVRWAFAIIDTTLATVNLVSAAVTVGKILFDFVSQDKTNLLLSRAAKGIGTVGIIATVGLIISVGISIGLFVHQVASAGINVTSLAFTQALSGLIAGVIVAIILTVLGSIPVFGTLLQAIIAIIDVIANLVCVALGQTATNDNFCGGITGKLTQAIQWLIYDQSPLVDLANENRLNFTNFDFALVDPTLGLSVGNHITMTVDVGTALYQADPEFTAASLAWFWQFEDATQYPKSTFRYYIEDAPSDLVDTLALNQMVDAWQKPGPESWAADSRLVTKSTVQGVVGLNTAGVNAKQQSLDLIEGFAIPVQECWAFPIPAPPGFATACYIRAMKDQLRLSLADSMIFDVFPSKLDFFYQLTARDNGGYALDWDDEFPTLTDADGDGLRSAAVGGNDPDDSNPDTDGDTLSDFYEIAQGTNPLEADEDGDNLTDAEELRYGTNPQQADTDRDGLRDDEEIAGWSYVYAFNGNTPLTTWVWSDPLEANVDNDEYTDIQERTYGFNPNVYSSSNILTLESTLNDSDGIVKRGDFIEYTASVENTLRNRHALGIAETTFPAPLASSDFAVENFTLAPNGTFTQRGELHVQTSTTEVVSVTTTVGAAVLDLNEQIAGRTLWLQLEESSGTQFSDASLNDHHAFCNGVGCPTRAVPGFRRKAAKFNGTNDTLSIAGTGSELGLANDSFTVLAWVSSDTVADKRALFSQSNLGSSNPFVLGFNNGRPAFGHISSAIAPSAIGTLEWHRVAWRYDRSTQQVAIFVDGKRVVIVGVGSYDHSQLTNLTFALNATGGGWSRYDGVIDEVEIYPRALTDEEIDADDAGGGGQVFYFTFDNANGSTEGRTMLDNTDYANMVACFNTEDDYLCPSTNLAGFVEKSYQFGAGDEFSDILQVSAAPNLDLSRGRGSFAISAWVNKIPEEGGWVLGGNNYPAFRIESDYARIQFSGCSLEAQSGGILGGATSDRSWHHVVVSFDGTTATAYADNQLIGSQNCAGAKPATADSFYIGGRDATRDGQGFQGNLDELRIFNHAVDAQQVADLFYATTPKLELRFDEAPGQIVVRDYSLSGIDGTCGSTACPVTGIDGRVNRAARFDGVNDALTLASANALGLLEHSFAAAAWVKADSWAALPVLGTLDTGDNTLYLGMKGGVPYAKIGRNEYSGTAPTNLNKDRWVYLIWHYLYDTTTQKGTLSLYADGLRRGNFADVPPLTGSSTVYVGRNGSSYFAGDIDQVQIFRQALSSQEITALNRQSSKLLLRLDEAPGTTTFANIANPATPATCSGTACPQAGTKGRIYQGVTFDGINDGLAIRDGIGMGGGVNFDLHLSQKFAVGLWVRPTQRKNGAWQTLVTKSDGSKHNYRLAIKPGSMTLHYTIGLCSTANSALLHSIDADAGELLENAWNHLMLTYDGNEAIVYINGSKSHSTTYSGFACLNDDDVHLGFRSAGQEHFAGEMDEVAIYIAPVSAADIAEIAAYQAGWFDTSVSQSILIDNDVPTVDLDLDTDLLPLEDRILVIDAGDPTSGIGSVEYSVNGGTWMAAVRDANAWLMTFVPTTEGNYTIDLRATDVAGNQATGQKRLFVDGSGPELGYVNVEGGQYRAVTRNDANDSWDLAIAGTVTANNSPTAGVWVELFDANGVSASGRMTTTVTANQWQVDYPFALRPSGVYTASIDAMDAIGNRTSRDVSTRIDGQPPTATIDSTGVSTTTIDSGTTIGGSVNENGSTAVNMSTFAAANSVAATSVVASGINRVEISFHPAARNEQSSAQWQQDGLLLHLALDEPLTNTTGAPTALFVDSTGNGFDASCTNCPTPGARGNFGTAADFDGSGESLVVPALGGALTDRAFSIGGWLNADGASSGQATLFALVDEGNSAQQSLRYDADQQRFVYNDSVTGDRVGAGTVAPNAWHNWFLTVDAADQAVLYLNGSATDTFTTTVRPTITDTLRLGEFFLGQLDDIVVYDQSLTADEVAQFYRGYAPLLRLPLDEKRFGVGETVYDGSRYQHEPRLQADTTATELFGTTGKVGGGALPFAGNPMYLSVPASPIFDLSAGAFTQMAWVYPQPTDSSARYPIFDGGSTGANPAQAYPSLTIVQRSRLEVGFGNGTNWLSHTTGELLAENSWNFVAVTFDGVIYNIYVNGVLRDSTALFAGKRPHPATQFNIGGSGTASLRGRLDEVVLYAQTLSASEIAALFHQGWRAVNLAASGGGVASTTWSYPAPAYLQGSYQIQLRTTDVNGNSSYGWLGSERWHGYIDTKPLADGPGGVGATDGFSPLSLWLRADSKVNRGVNNFVYSWLDRSGKGQNAGSPVFTKSPYYFGNQINGQPVVRFNALNDGAADLMTIPDKNFFDFAEDRSFVLFSVINTADPDMGAVVSKDVAGGQSAWGTRVEGGTFRFQLDDGVGNQPVLASTNPITDSAHIFMSYRDRDNSLIHLGVDGTTTSTADTTIAALANSNPLILGAFNSATNGALSGDIAEVILLDGAVTSVARNLIHNYLSARYAISLPPAIDYYHGDDPANGNYDRDVAGVGQEADGSQILATSAGLLLSVDASTLDDGEYLIAGHKSAGNDFISADDTPDGLSRMQRVWYVEKTGAISATLAFDFSAANIQNSLLSQYSLLYRANEAALYTSLVPEGTVAGDQVSFSLADQQLQNGYYTLACSTASAIIVTSAANSGPGTLRQALNDVCSGGTIVFAPNLTGQTIALTTGEIVINKSVTIDGANAPGLAISGNDASRVFRINSGREVILRNLTLTDGSEPLSNNGCAAHACGGLIYNAGTLTVQYSTLKESWVQPHSAGAGGAIYSTGTVIILHSTLVNNSTRFGGALYTTGAATIINSTFSNNRAENFGDSVFNNGTLLINQSTLLQGATHGNANLWNSIDGTSLVQNSLTGQIDGTVTPLQDNGGPTLTHMPLATSAAIDSAGSNCQRDDQRGVSRPQGAACDKGSVEYDFALNEMTIGAAAAKEGNDDSGTLDFVIYRPNPSGSSSVTYVTADGTAQAGSDYTAANGVLFFAAGQLTRTVSIDLLGDTNTEPNETLTLQLSSPVNATLLRTAATGTIQNDDGLDLNNGPGGVGDQHGASMLAWWLRGDSITGANGANITTWPDRSGYGKDATQSDAALQPSLTTNALNGQTVVRFDDGTPERMSMANHSALVTDTQTIFVVGQHELFDSDVLLSSSYAYTEPTALATLKNSSVAALVAPEVVALAATTAGPILEIGSDGIDDRVQLRDSSESRQAVTTVADTSYHLQVLRWGADDSVRYYRDGTLVGEASGADLQPTQHQSTVLGAAATDTPPANPDHLDGNLAEVIIYNRDLNSAERILIENYLSARYSLPITTTVDFYHGDEAGLNDYDVDVAGIGQEANGNHTLASSAGLVISADSVTLDDGDYLLAGRKAGSNSFVTTDLPATDLTSDVAARWDRVWYVEKTGQLNATLGFDLSGGGINQPIFEAYKLLYSPTDPFGFTTMNITHTVTDDRIDFALGDAALQNGYYTLACTDRTLYVTNTNNSGPGSLREAIGLNPCYGTTIYFDPSLAGQTITLTSGEIVINRSLLIDAKDAPGLTISGNNSSRIFHVRSGPVEIRNLTLANARNSLRDSDCGNIPCGGALRNRTQLTLDTVTVRDNRVAYPGNGGAIQNSGTLTITNSTLHDNAIVQTTTLYGYGGAVQNSGTLFVSNSTFSGNSTNTADSDPNWSHGHAIANTGSAIITATTIADAGAAVYLTAGRVTLWASIITGGCRAINSSVINADTSNLGACGSGLAGNADLGPLQNNGGPTPTRLLGAGSSAIDVLATCAVATDQRGTVRPQGSACDIGAVEMGAVTLGLSNRAERSTVAAGETVRFTLVITNSGNDWASGISISNTLPISWQLVANSVIIHEVNGAAVNAATVATDTANLPTLARGLTIAPSGQLTVSYVATSPSGSGGTVTNTAVLSSTAPNVSFVQQRADATVDVLHQQLLVGDGTVVEGDSSEQLMTFVITRTANFLDTSITYGTVNDSATAGSDFVPHTATPLFLPVNGPLTATVSVAIQGDLTVEADEQFYLRLLNVTGAEVLDNEGIGTIRNDDSATVTLLNGSGVESSGVVNLAVALSAPVDVAVSMAVTTTDGTASGEDDYIPQRSQVITIAAGVLTGTLAIAVTDDTLVEGDETVLVALGALQNNGRTVTFGTVNATATILGDDIAALTLSPAVTVGEGVSGTVDVPFVVTLEGDVQDGFTVGYALVDGTATGGSDYQAQSGIVTFGGYSGETQQITATVNGDTIVEADETFLLTLGTVTGGAAAAIRAANAPQTVTIRNDDITTVTLSGGGSQAEGNGATTSYRFTATLASAVQGGFDLVYHTDDGSATVVDNDYVDNSGQVRFAGLAGETQQIVVAVNGDVNVEGDETFSVALDGVTALDAAVDSSLIAIVESPQVGLIVNDDQALLTLTAGAPRVEETFVDGSYPFSVTLSAPVQGGLSVRYRTVDGTATAGDGDFEATESELIFSGLAGETQFVSIRLFGDAKIENDESFALALAQMNPFAAAVMTSSLLLPTAQVTATILNDDHIDLTVGDVQVQENAGIAAFPVQLSVVNDLTTTVAYSTTALSALAGEDYVPTAGILTIPPQALSGVISVTIVDDGNYELPENFTLTLSAPEPHDIVALLDSTATGTIVNDDPPLLSIGDLTVNEGAGVASFVLTLGGVGVAPITVTYGTADQSALAGLDYSAVASATVVIPLGAVTTTVAVPILEDLEEEPDEHFVINILSVTNAVITDGVGVATIIDNEVPQVAVRVDANRNIVNVGDVITYSYQITNTGALTLETLLAGDNRFGTVPLSVSRLAPGAVATAIVTQNVILADLPGPLVNQLSVVGTTALNREATATDSVSVALVHAAVTLQKTVSVATIRPACTPQTAMKVPVNTPIVYCYTLTNQGTSTMLLGELVDSHLGLLVPATGESLAPAAQVQHLVTATLTVSTTNIATWTVALPTAVAAQLAPRNDGEIGTSGVNAATITISSATDDQDGDTIPDNLEGAADLDGDNIPNFLDTDSDGDLRPDRDEVGPDPLQPQDSNQNGVPDYLEAYVSGVIYLPIVSR